MNWLKQRRFALTFGTAMLCAAPNSYAQDAASKPVTLGPEQVLQTAISYMQKGDAPRALALADALLKRDPNDVGALLVRAKSLRGIGRFDEAKAAARAGWRHAETDNQKFSAAMLMAQALSSDGNKTRAQLWLRRAAQVAPTDRHAAQATRDFKYVGQRNPWQTHLSFTLAPNSNINNGSARDSSTLLYRTAELFGFDGSEETALGASNQALSGIEAGINVQSRYRFHQTEHSAHDLRMGFSYRSYQLSNSSKDDLEQENAERLADGRDLLDVSGSDFSYGTIQLGYGYKKLRGDRRGEFSATADIGQSFYGGARYNRYLRGRIGQSYYKDARTKINFGLSTDLRTAGGNSDQYRVSLNTGVSRQLKAGNGLYFGASVSTLQADAEQSEYEELSLRSGYVLGRKVMGTQLQFGLNTSYRDYDVSPHDPSGRREFTVGAEVTATFKNIDYYGFNPTISLTAATTSSNIGLYDVNRVGLGFGIASSF
ncbi:hypothetical protein [Sulfitobacter sp.]|uniref:hypothetical protein n=1 Tax=Sulfitobacter sp. TaxID=1903071 RepID=UPI0030037224